MPHADIDIRLDLPELGPISGKLELAPEIRVHDDRTIRRNPDWRAFNEEQARKGNEVSRTEVADAWRDFGDEHGNDYWKLGIIRWMSLLQRDPNAATARSGTDDLFHIDLLEIDSKADVIVARERRLPDDAQRIAAIKKRSASGYKIKSL